MPRNNDYDDVRSTGFFTPKNVNKKSKRADDWNFLDNLGQDVEEERV